MVISVVKLILHRLFLYNFVFFTPTDAELVCSSCIFQKSQTPKMAATPKRNQMFVPPQIFKTEDYFRSQSAVSAPNECTVGFSNGTVASSCNNHVLPTVPSDSLCVNDPPAPVLVADVHELTCNSHSDSFVVDDIPKTESTYTSVVISSSDTQPLNS